MICEICDFDFLNPKDVEYFAISMSAGVYK